MTLRKRGVFARKYGWSPQGTFWLEFFDPPQERVFCVHVVCVGIVFVVGVLGVVGYCFCGRWVGFVWVGLINIFFVWVLFCGRVFLNNIFFVWVLFCGSSCVVANDSRLH